MERKSFSTEIYPPSFGAKKPRECKAPGYDAYIYIASSTGNVLATVWQPIYASDPKL